MSTEELDVQAAQGAAEDEFEQAFKEFSGSAAKADDTLDDETPEQIAPAADSEAGGGEQNTPTHAEPTVEELKRQLEETRKAAQDFEHRFKSEVGRQTAYQRQIQELKQQIQNPPQTQAQQRRLSERMAKIAEDFPELAQAFQEELSEAIGQVRQEVDQHLQPIRQKEQESYYRLEEDRVREAYPDFNDVVRSTDFQTWFSQQPEAVRSLAASPMAQDAIAVLDYYTGGKRFQQEPNAKVQQVQARRQDALQRHTSVRNTAPAPVTDAPDDFESAFKFYARRLGKK